MRLIKGDFARQPLATATSRADGRFSLDAKALPVDLVVEAPGRKEFQVTRTVVFPDQHVYEIMENVRERGLYTIVSKKLLLKDAARIGVLHFGDI